MGTLKSFDVKVAMFLKHCSNYYIRRRTYIPAPPPPPTPEEKWESLFGDSDSLIYKLDDEISIYLFKNSILCKLIYFGFELNEIGFIKKYLKNGDTFFDIGANIGLYTLHASKIIGNNGKVFAFEPTLGTFERLKQNIHLNELSNVKYYNIGLSNQKTILDLYVSNDGHDAWNSFALTDFLKESDTIKVEVDTIDTFIIENKIGKIDLIKLDVEGWEKYVLQGASELLSRDDSPVMMVEFTETNAFAAGYYLGEVYDFIEDFGYRWYSCGCHEHH